MIPPRTRSEVRSQYNFKPGLGASTLDAPSPPWEAQRPPGIELPSRLSASVADLCCRALDCRHVCTSAQLRTAQVGCAVRCFSPGFLFSLFDSVRTPWLIFIEIEVKSIFDGAFRFCRKGYFRMNSPCLSPSFSASVSGEIINTSFFPTPLTETTGRPTQLSKVLDRSLLVQIPTKLVTPALPSTALSRLRTPPTCPHNPPKKLSRIYHVR